MAGPELEKKNRIASAAEAEQNSNAQCVKAEVYPKYFLYDPDRNECILFKDLAERDIAANKAIQDYLSDNEWDEGVNLLSVGEITGVARAVNIVKKPDDSELDELGEDEEGRDFCNHDFYCDYKIVPLSEDSSS